MGRPVTLFTGQWADLECEAIITKAKEMGYDGVEFGCWGDHFEVDKADADYCKAKRDLLSRWTFSFLTVKLLMCVLSILLYA